MKKFKIRWKFTDHGWFFSVMEWFWLCHVTLFLLLCTFLLNRDFSHEFRTRMPENNFYSWKVVFHAKGLLKNRKSYEIFLSHIWNPSSSVSNTGLIFKGPSIYHVDNFSPLFLLCKNLPSKSYFIRMCALFVPFDGHPH